MCTGVAHFTVVHRGDLVDVIRVSSIDCPYFIPVTDKVEKAHVTVASSREAVVEGERQEP
jgi:uncharacterized protein YwlG (UPF0340 family)